MTNGWGKKGNVAGGPPRIFVNSSHWRRRRRQRDRSLANSRAQKARCGKGGWRWERRSTPGREPGGNDFRVDPPMSSAPRPGKKAPNAEARRREYPHHSITKLVGFRIDQRKIGHVVPFAIGQPNTIAAPGGAGLPIGHRRCVVDNSGHIPAIDLDGEAVSRVTAWAADFVSKGFDPIPSFGIESRKHLQRPAPHCRCMVNGGE